MTLALSFFMLFKEIILNGLFAGVVVLLGILWINSREEIRELKKMILLMDQMISELQNMRDKLDRVSDRDKY